MCIRDSTQIDAAGNNCGLTTDGDIACWLSNIEPPTGGPYIDLAVTGGSVCGLTSDGQLDCAFGSFVSDANRTQVSTISTNTRFTAIEAGRARFSSDISLCGVREDDGTLQCFGGGSVPQTISAENQASLSGVENFSLSLTATAYGPNAIELFWNRLPSQFPRIFVEVFRDNELLTTSGSHFSFYDTDPVPATESTYRIRAVDEGGNTGPFSNTITVSRENIGIVESSTDSGLFNPRANNGLRIENLRIQPLLFANSSGNSSGTVVLSWDMLNDENALVAGYEIRQNDESVGFTGDRVFVIEDVSLSFCGVFSVLAIGDDGEILETSSNAVTPRTQSFCGLF